MVAAAADLFKQTGPWLQKENKQIKHVGLEKIEFFSKHSDEKQISPCSYLMFFVVKCSGNWHGYVIQQALYTSNNVYWHGFWWKVDRTSSRKHAWHLVDLVAEAFLSCHVCSLYKSLGTKPAGRSMAPDSVVVGNVLFGSGVFKGLGL